RYTGPTSTGIPFTTVAVHARVRARDALTGLRLVVPPAVRQRHHAGHHFIAHLDRDLEAAGLRGHARRRAPPHPAAGGVVGMDEQRAAVPSPHEHLDVVEPGVVRAQVAA